MCPPIYLPDFGLTTGVIHRTIKGHSISQMSSTPYPHVSSLPLGQMLGYGHHDFGGSGTSWKRMFFTFPPTPYGTSSLQSVEAALQVDDLLSVRL